MKAGLSCSLCNVYPNWTVAMATIRLLFVLSKSNTLLGCVCVCMSWCVLTFTGARLYFYIPLHQPVNILLVLLTLLANTFFPQFFFGKEDIVVVIFFCDSFWIMTWTQLEFVFYSTKEERKEKIGEIFFSTSLFSQKGKRVQKYLCKYFYSFQCKCMCVMCVSSLPS